MLRRLSTLSLTLSALGCLAVTGPLAAAELPADRAAAIDAFIDPFVDFAMFDGTVVIDVAGEEVYRRSFGLANYEHRVGHTPETRFRIASVSKSLTDAAIAVLIAQERLSLDDPLARFLPDFPGAETIRVRQLLDYTSGIPHTNVQPWGDGKTSLTLDEIVERLAALPLDFPPGSDSSYSNGGYAVAAKVLEIVGGADYGDVMRRLLFDPLGMTGTAHLADARQVVPGMATGYEPGPFPGERRHSRFYAVETRPGGGSLYSTADDMLAFMRGVFRQDFVGEALRREVMGADEEGFLSQGRSPGFVAKAYYAAGEDVIVVSLANSYAVPADWARTLAGLATGESEEVPWPRLEPAAPTVAADDPRLGVYASSRGGTTSIARGARGAMFVEDRRSESITGLVPLADGAWLMPLYFQRCERDAASGKIACRILSGDPRYTTELTPLGN